MSALGAGIFLAIMGGMAIGVGVTQPSAIMLITGVIMLLGAGYMARIVQREGPKA